MVDYNDAEQLRFALQGADLVISTISGAEQLNLIDAARHVRVRRFVPSEFEGPLDRRPNGGDPLDHGSQEALARLHTYARANNRRMQFTVFSCGIFYERFSLGGLQGYDIGASCGLQGPGQFLVNLAIFVAEIGETDPRGRQAHVSLTSVYDVVRFVTAAIEIGPDHWPAELRMQGDAMTVRDVVNLCEETRGGE